MRIAYLVECFSRLSETFIFDRVQELVRQGHEVHVITPKRALVAERPYEPIHLIGKPGHLSRLSMKLRGMLQGGGAGAGEVECNKFGAYQRERIVEVLRTIRPDLLHAEFGQMGTLAAPVAQQLNLPFVVFMHGSDITKYGQQPQWLRCYQRMWPLTGLVLTPSGFMREKVIAMGAPAQKVVVQHNGIDLGTWQFSDPSARFDGREVRFLFVGRLVEKKGPLQLIKAFDACRRQLGDAADAKLVLCGDGPLRVASEELAAELQLGDSVELLGACPHQRVREEMQKAHVLVQHSVTAASGDMEGLPVSLTEAAAIGLPIVATRHSGIPEIVRDGVNGYLVAENDVEDMAARMATMARAPESWSVLGKAGRELVENEFGQSATIEAYVARVGGLVGANG